MRSPAPIRASFAAIAAGFLILGSAFGQGRLLEPVTGFYGPAGAVFTPDGRTLFVANSARTDYGMLAGKGAISRVEVGAEGAMTVAQPRLIEGLNAPIGVALLPATVGPIPSGSLVVVVGGRWTMKDRNSRVEDARERETGLLFFDPKTGARLGAAFLGQGSPLESVLGRAVQDPSHVTFDGTGTAYLSDVAGLGLKQNTIEENRPGIVRLTAAALAALIAGEAPARAEVAFLDVPEVAGGIAWSEDDDMLYWATGPGYGDLSGAVLRLPGGDFGPTGSIKTVHKEIYPMVGACLTPDGSLIVAHSDGTMGVIKGGRGKVRPVKFRDKEVFIAPGQPAATNLADGRVLVVVPEMAAGGRPAWRHRLQVFTLPSGF